MNATNNDLNELERTLMARVDAANDEAALEAVRVDALGKQGAISALMKNLGSMSPDERKTFGAALNSVKDKVSEAIVVKKATLAEAALDRQLQSEAVDVTLPPVKPRLGTIHPVSQVMEELAQIFGEMGFSLEEGPDIETDFNNFTALNFPKNHPARETQDTFFMNTKGADGERMVLRTHTSPVQVRTMLKQKPPIRVIVPGRTYRVDNDATHTPMFHQLEALVIDEKTHLGNLKWVVEEFCKAFFEIDNVTLRARPSYFPFTEPSVEWDMRCDRSVPGKITFGTGNDWLELGGSGMVHPNVLEMCGIDSKKYQGFAFGFGLDRMAMLKYGAPDLRPFFESDVRWLRHYGFAALDLPTLDGGLSR